MTDVFISYSRRDKEFVQRLSERLKESSRDFWVDWEDIPPTVDWMKEIERGIETADAFAYVISPDSVRSEICTTELIHALENKKRLFPLLYREIEDQDDREKLHPAISSHNWIYFREHDDFDKGFQTLISALDTDYEHARAHTRLLIRAMEWANKDRDNSSLLRGNDLLEAESWIEQAAGKQPEPTEMHETYIAVSRRAATVRTRFAFTVGGFLALVSLLAVAIFVLFIQAESNRQIAVAARQTSDYNGRQASSLALASNAQQTLYRDNNTDLALALALASNNVGGEPPAQAQSVLAQAAFAPGTRLRLDGFTTDFNGGDTVTSPDGTRALAYRENGMMQHFSLADGSVINEWQSDIMEEAAFLPDGERALITSAITGAMELRDVFTGEVLVAWADATGAALTISPDGDQALVSGYAEDYTLYLWDLSDIQPQDATTSAHEDRLLAQLTGHEATVRSISISADGTTAASSDENGIFVVWDLAARAERMRVDTIDRANDTSPNNNQLWDVAVNHDGTRILTGGEDWVVRLWEFNVEADTYVQINRMLGHVNRVWQVAFLPDESQAISGSYDNNVILWDLTTGEEVRRFLGHTNTVYGLAVLPGGRRALTASWDGTVRIWNLDNGAELQRFDPSSGVLRDVALHSESGLLVTVGDFTDAVLWNALTGERLGEFVGHNDLIRDADFSPDGTLLATGADDGEIILWDVATRTVVRRWMGHADTVHGVEFSPDGRTLLSSSRDNSEAEDGTQPALMRLWDVESGRLIRPFLGHTARVYKARFSADGRYVISASSDETVIYWNVELGTPIYVMEDHEGVIYDAAFSPDGRFAASAGGDNILILWNLADGTRVRTFNGHGGPVYTVSFHPDGSSIASGSRDGTVRTWDVADGAEVGRFDGHTDSVWSVIYSPDGSYLFSASADQTAREWQLFSLDALMQWTFANRYVQQLSCDQRDVYRIEPRCNAAGVPPVPTAYLTMTPQLTAVPPTLAAGTPTSLPSLTPTLTPDATLEATADATESGG